MSDISKRIGDLSAKKYELLLRRLNQGKPGSARPPIIPRRGDGGFIPLSFAQERLWVLDQLLPNNAAYNIPMALRLSGPLVLAALRDSFNGVMRRHEALRTTFATVDGRPAQVIAPAPRAALRLVDLRGVPDHERPAAVERLIHAETRQPFDLARGPLIRVTLLRLGAAEHVALLTMHHIVSDAWSIGVFVRDLTALYAAFVAGRPASLPELPVQYADYAVWQRAWLQGSGVRGQGSGDRSPDPPRSPRLRGDRGGRGGTETSRQGDGEQEASGSQSPIPNPQSPLQAQLAYWRGRLADLPTLALPTDHPRPAAPSFQGARHDVALPGALSDDLAALSQREGVTLFMTLLAAWQALLARYSGQDDIAIGTPIANRTQEQTEGLIGFFINTLVLRTSLAGNPTFHELLRRVREVCLDAYAHQDLPFEQLVEALHPARDLSRHPLFQVLFALQNAPLDDMELPGLTLQRLPVESGMVQFDMSLLLGKAASGLTGMLRYSTELFDAGTIARMLGHFQTVLHAIVARPELRLSDVPVLTDAEQVQLVAWNATQVEFRSQESGVRSAALCIYDLFEAQAARTPDAIALVFDRPTTNDQRPTTNDRSPLHPFTPSPVQHLSYHELHHRATQLATYLHTLGVGPEVRVAVCLERSPELVVGLLGIWKAGGAYVPLDPNYPQERLAFMLEDSQAAVLITTTDQRPTTNDQRQAPLHPFTPSPLHPFTLSPPHLVTLSQSWSAIARYVPDDPISALDPTNLAYVIYTSGSTGRPKGVLVEHRNLLNVLWAGREQFAFQPGDVMPWIASTAFDIALFELLTPLLAGGTSIILPQQRVLDIPRLADDLAHVTAIHAVPSLMRRIVHEIAARERAPRSYDQIRAIFVGGDLVPPDLLAALQAAFRRATVCVLYGPTEGTIFCTRYVAPAGQRIARHLIGTPPNNMQVWLCDRQQRLVPVGVPGELHIGGAGVARGYLNRPDLTAERFIPNPFARGMGDGGWGMGSESSIPHPPSPIPRLYKTGDLARYRPDGVLEFLGRRDEQVKVRGYRIELGEVEAQLGQHPAVREAVVVAQADAAGELRLVAYVVTTNDQRPTTNDQRASTPDSSSVLSPQSSVLRAFLQTRLPDYMLPAAFVFLGALPLTTNGKVDRAALPALGQDRPALERGYVAPHDELERLLAALWQDVLGLDAVGVHDNFFELGGNSIQAIIFVNKLQERLGEIVYVVAVFDAPTVAELAAYLTRHYPGAVARVCGMDAPSDPAGRDAQAETVDEAKVALIRRLIPPLPPRTTSGARKNLPAVFILSPPRSGSTLLRVMLAGHPGLFAPPELELLSFNTLAERKKAFSGRNRFWLEGTIRAIMEIKGCDAVAAERLMAGYEDQGLTVQQFYALAQTWIAPKTLVDKTPSYALDPAILERAEVDFDQPRYIHLLRHPYGMIRSFEEAKLDQVFFLHQHPFTTRALAELIWLISQQNILAFLERVPPQRQYVVRFEELVKQPRSIIAGVCRFLGLDFHPDMLEPYKGAQRKMTDGVHALSKMVGDVKFHEHRAIDPATGERWRLRAADDLLGDLTWQVAEALGYPRVTPGAAAAPAPHTALAPIRPIPRDGRSVFPLSFAQQRLWFLDRLEPGSATYTMPAALRLSGPLDVAALRRSLTVIVGRHEVLRTTFALVEGQPAQVIAPAGQVPLALLDLRALPAPEREDAARQLATAEARRPFDLARGPLLRAALLRLACDQHVLLLTLHHIIADGWSIGVLIRELTALYGACVAGAPLALPPLPIQYADYALWQRAWLQGSEVGGQGSGVGGLGATAPVPPPAGGGTEGGRSQGATASVPPPAGGGTEGGAETRRHGDTETQPPTPNTQHLTPIEAQLAYWKRQLAGLAMLELPTDYPRPALPAFRGASCTFALPPALGDDLAALSRRAGVTLFTTLLAAWQALLARYTSQDDIVVGTTVAGRTRKETEGLIGCFLNTLVLRGDLAGDPTFSELLPRVRAVCLGAYAHQDIPFEQLVEALQRSRDLSRHPLFQVMFVLQNVPAAEPELPGLTLRALAVDQGTAKFDLSLSLAETAAGIAGALEYRTDLFEAATIARMLGHFQLLLEGIAAQPGQRLAALPLLTDAEREQVLVAWNATDRGVRSQGSGVRSESSDAGLLTPNSWCIHHLFAAQAAATPDAIAVVFDRGQGSAVRGQGATVPLPPPVGGGIEGGVETRRQGDKEIGRSDTLPSLSPQSSVLSPQSLTYAELNRRANQLAQHLHALGVGPEARVGLCLERSLELLIGLLGILKAGAAYVPLDPAYPPERLAFMLEDAQVSVLLTTDHRPPTNDDQSTYGYDISHSNDDPRRSATTEQRRPTTTNDDRSTYGYDISYPNDDPRRPTTTNPRPQSKIQNPKPALSAANGSKIVHLDADWPIIAAEPLDDPACPIRPDNLAYVIYTSGSTGQPKGVMVAHRGVCNLAAAQIHAFAVGSQSRVLQFASLSFDAAVSEVCMALLAGATLYLAARAAVLPGPALTGLLREQGITVVTLPPSVLATAPVEPLPALQTLVVAGEACPATLAARWVHGRRFVNAYGPTEATVCATLAAWDDGRRAPPIGRPIADTQVYLLDRHMAPVPIGVAGELHIAGAGLARGYLNRPDLSAERFIPNPFAEGMGDKRSAGGGLGWGMEDASPSPIPHPPSPGTRLYRTGDRARYWADGRIEFLGRIDAQIKLRGFRIEPGEIEAAIVAHPAVRACAVVARADTRGDRRLVAYVVTTNDQRPTTNDEPEQSSFVVRRSSLVGELRAFVQERLPNHMIPSAFVTLEALPLTPSGKLDRAALPDPGSGRPELDGAYLAPRTELERTISAIWQEVLQLEKVGTQDNFFDLGGHSLLTVTVQSKLRETLGRDVPLVDLFTYPTVGALAHYLSRPHDEGAAPDGRSTQERVERAESRSELRGQRRQIRHAHRAARQRTGELDE